MTLINACTMGMSQRLIANPTPSHSVDHATTPAGRDAITAAARTMPKLRRDLGNRLRFTRSIQARLMAAHQATATNVPTKYPVQMSAVAARAAPIGVKIGGTPGITPRLRTNAMNSGTPSPRSSQIRKRPGTLLWGSWVKRVQYALTRPIRPALASMLSKAAIRSLLAQTTPRNHLYRANNSAKRLIVAVGELREEIVFVERKMLRERDGDHPFSRIDARVSRSGAVP